MIISYKGINGYVQNINDTDKPIFERVIGEGTDYTIGIIEHSYPEPLGKTDKKCYSLILISQFTCFEVEHLQYEELICNVREEEVDMLLEHRAEVIPVTRTYYNYDNKGNKEEYYTQTMNWHYLYLERYIRNYMHNIKFQKISVEKQKDSVLIEFGQYNEFLKEDLPF